MNHARLRRFARNRNASLRARNTSEQTNSSDAAARIVGVMYSRTFAYIWRGSVNCPAPPGTA